MADTYNEYNGTGSQDTFTYDFPYLKTTDVKVSVDGVLKELTTDYTRPTVTSIQFNSDKIPADGTKVRVYRDTDEATVNATFYPGSAIKSSDLNDNFLQAVYIGEEGKENADDAWNKLEDTIDSTETWVSDNTKIGTTGAVDARVDSKIDTELTNSSKNFSTSGTLAAGATTVTGNIAVSGTVDGRDVAADGTKLDGIDTGAKDDQTAAEIKTLLNASQLGNDQLASNCIATANIQNGNVTNAKIATDAISTDRIIDANITTDKLADNAVTEVKLSISNAGSNGQFLQKQSGNAGGLTWASSIIADGTTGIDFNDNVEVRFGTGNDLEIYHDGTDSFIHGITRSGSSGTRYLKIRADETRMVNEANSAIVARFIDGGAVELYHNNDLRLQTWSDGVNIHGDEGEDAILHLYADNGDNNADKWKLVGSANGSFYIRNYTSGAWETSIKAVGNGKTQLYYDDSEKFETTSEGALVVGALGINGQNTTHAANTLKIGHEGSGVHQLRAYGPDTSNNGKIQFNSSRSDGTNPKSITYSAGNLEFPDTQKIRMGSAEDLQIYHEGVSNNHSYIQHTATDGHLWVSSGANMVFQVKTDKKGIGINAEADVELYYNGVKTLTTESTGITILGAEGGDASIHIYSDEGDDAADKIRLRKPAGDNLLMIEAHNGTAWEDLGRFNVGGTVQLYHDGVSRFRTTAQGAIIDGSLYISDNENLVLNDANKATFGNAEDMKMYHDGLNSYIQNGEGELRIKGDAIRLRGYSVNEMQISTYVNGTVALAYDGAQKFETTSTGAKVSGILAIQNGETTVPTMLIGANNGGSGMSNNSTKHANICAPQYLSDTQTGGFRLLSAYGNDGQNYCYIGGNDDNVASTASAPKSATEVRIYTAATATGNGVQALKIDLNQNATFAGNVDIAGAIIENHSAITDAASPALDPENGTVQTWTLNTGSISGTRTPSDSILNGQSMLLMINAGDGTDAITWPSTNWVGGGTGPTVVTSGYTCIELWKVSGTLYGSHVGDVA